MAGRQKSKKNRGRMRLENAVPYEYHGYEPAVFVELYLPKKAKYQGKLYEALTNGLRLGLVKENFRRKKEEIATFLKRYSEVGEYTDDRINNIEPSYYGYSMYEVDGVFFNHNKRTIAEERTQIIRILFLPDIEKIQSLTNQISYLETRRGVKTYLRGDSQIRKELRQSNQRMAEYLDKWIADVGLFLFGYIIFEICERIKHLNKDEQQPLEDEIWLTSFWNLEVNRVRVIPENASTIVQ